MRFLSFPDAIRKRVGEEVGDKQGAWAGAYVHRLPLSIDHALGVIYRHDIYNGKTKFVARNLVKGIPFYRYHVGSLYF